MYFTDFTCLTLFIDGGAGTTAIGLLLGKPTIVVPFFGDQPFWGQMIHKAGAGPEPIPQKALTAEVLASGIEYCKTPAAQTAAQYLADQIRNEVRRYYRIGLGFHLSSHRMVNLLASNRSIVIFRYSR